MRNFINIVESIQINTAQSNLTEDEISRARRWGLIKRLRNAISREDIMGVEGELQVMDSYQPWPELDRVKAEYLNFVKNNLDSKFDKMLAMNYWLFELDVKWPELLKLVQDWAEQNKEKINAKVTQFAGYGPSHAAYLIKNFKLHGVDWPEFNQTITSRVPEYLNKLANEIKRNSVDNMLTQMSWTIIHMPEVQQWLNDNRSSIIRLLLIMIKKEESYNVKLVVNRFIDAGLDWPELRSIQKSVGIIST